MNYTFIKNTQRQNSQNASDKADCRTWKIFLRVLLAASQSGSVPGGEDVPGIMLPDELTHHE